MLLRDQVVGWEHIYISLLVDGRVIGKWLHWGGDRIAGGIVEVFGQGYEAHA